MINKHRNIKILLSILESVNIEILINFKQKYGYIVLDYLVRNNLIHLINIYSDNNYPLLVCKNLFINNQIDMIHVKYGNHIHREKFIKVLGSNISKLTLRNIDNIFMMFILTHINKFKGFESWGPGNNKTHELNISNHYKKHVINKHTYKENWDQYLKKMNLESYKNFAIDKSKYMKNKIIHTNGNRVFLSGVYEKVLIIGRLDENNKLGISSCYIMTDMSYNNKMKVFDDNACFKF